MSVEEVCERIKQSLQDHFSDLENATKHCIEKLSSQLYSKGLVTVAVREAPACSKIHDELKAGLEQMKHFTPLKIHYQKFLECLSAQGGPSKGVSDQLREEWEEIKQKYEEVSRGGERGKSDLVTNKQLSVILDQQVKQQDEKMEIMKKDFESRLKEKEEVTERLNTELKETQEEKRLLQEKKSQELEQLETDRMKGMEEEIQVLTAQVNAYSRECEKQKGLVAQNQERHKTEIQELNEKLTNEQKSKQQLESQLTTMKKQFVSVSATKESLQKSSQKLVNELTVLRQQVDSLTASKESILTAYNEEKAMVTSLRQHLQRTREESAKIKEESAAMKHSNKVLKDKVLFLQQQPSSLTAKPVVSSHPTRRTMLPHTHTSSKQEPVNQRQPKTKIKQQQAAADDSDSDIEENPLLENIDGQIHEMAEEVRRMSRRPDTQEVLFDDEDSSLPYDPNLVCPKCGRQYRVGELQKLKRHINEFCTGKR